MKRLLLRTLISTFIVAAVLGIGIIVFSIWNDFTEKVLATTITLFGYSIPGLCCAINFEKAKTKKFAQLGMVATFTGCIYMLIYFWCFSNVFEWDSIINKFIYTSLLVPEIFGHISLMLLVNSKETSVNYWKYGTINMVGILGILGLLSIFLEMDFDGQIVAPLIILAVLGSIVTPLLNKLKKDSTKDKPKEASPFMERYEEIAKLKELLDSGAITQEEFDSEKKKLLNS